MLQLEQLQVSHDVGERGVELVGDAGGHLADGGELLGLEELLLRLLQLLDRVLLPLEELGVLQLVANDLSDRPRDGGDPAPDIAQARHVAEQAAAQGVDFRAPLARTALYYTDRRLLTGSTLWRTGSPVMEIAASLPLDLAGLLGTSDATARARRCCGQRSAARSPRDSETVQRSGSSIKRVSSRAMTWSAIGGILLGTRLDLFLGSFIMPYALHPGI